MSQMQVFDAVIVEDEIQFSITELCRWCDADESLLVALVREGVIEPQGSDPADWRFAGTALPRARTALRLARDLDLSPAGTALVVDLLAELDALRARLRRVGLD